MQLPSMCYWIVTRKMKQLLSFATSPLHSIITAQGDTRLLKGILSGSEKFLFGLFPNGNQRKMMSVRKISRTQVYWAFQCVVPLCLHSLHFYSSLGWGPSWGPRNLLETLWGSFRLLLWLLGPLSKYKRRGSLLSCTPLSWALSGYMMLIVSRKQGTAVDGNCESEIQ